MFLKMKKPILLTLCLLLYGTQVFATHNRAGEITYTHKPDAENRYRYEIVLTTYTKEGSNVDRDSLVIHWGDNTESNIGRNNGPMIDDNFKGESVGNDIRKNTYSGVHSYPGPGEYLLWMQDLNRIDSIININFGNSMNEPFYIENTLKILDPQFYSFNNSPVLLQPPIDFAGIGIPYIHNPNAFDVDGDSLHFELVVPKISVDEEVPNYIFPNGISPGLNNNYTLNPETGEFIWDAPQQKGIYNVAIVVSEFRDGICIGTLRRDMQIIVKETDNTPPEIADLRDTCIIAGTYLEQAIVVTDDDLVINLEGFGGSFEKDTLPSEINITTMQAGLTEGLFSWQTQCDDILNQAYTVVIKAEDEDPNNSSHITLADLETWLIHVVPPAPENLTYQVISNSAILLNWASNYSCLNANKFNGFSVWRRQGCDTTNVEPCEIDSRLSGYTLLENDIEGFEYLDETALKGVSYTYRVIADFAELSLGGFPLNEIRSVPSNGACVFLPSDVPVITNVSIQQTDETNGQIYLAWSKPNAVALDTIFNPPPYVYKVYRATGIGNTDFELITETSPATTFALANDTIFFDGLLNTVNNAYTYQVGFYANDELVGNTNIASSVYLNALPAPSHVNINLNFEVPWQNNQYIIYRSNSPSGTFDSIGMANKPNYIDENLINGLSYCYYAEAVGTYQTLEIIDPLINLSQIQCAIPIDTLAPCSPTLTVTNDCNSNLQEWTTENFRNDLSWNNPITACGDEDLVAYNIYYALDNAGDFELIEQLSNVNQTQYQHFIENVIAGCYIVTAVDSFNNESPKNNAVCIENCFEYELPNTFTPNNDGSNDILTPVKNRFVQNIELKIFNRWGNLVFETNDPNINWNGTNQNGKVLSNGVYFYTGTVFQFDVMGQEFAALDLSGYIHLIKE